MREEVLEQDYVITVLSSTNRELIKILHNPSPPLLTAHQIWLGTFRFILICLIWYLWWWWWWFGFRAKDKEALCLSYTSFLLFSVLLPPRKYFSPSALSSLYLLGVAFIFLGQATFPSLHCLTAGITKVVAVSSLECFPPSVRFSNSSSKKSCVVRKCWISCVKMWESLLFIKNEHTVWNELAAGY